MERGNGLESFIDVLVDEIASRLGERVQGIGGRVASKAGPKVNRLRGGSLKGRKLNMDCRIEGCKNRSGGPRNRFMCEEHQKLPKREQIAALQKSRAAQA